MVEFIPEVDIPGGSVNYTFYWGTECGDWYSHGMHSFAFHNPDGTTKTGWILADIGCADWDGGER